MATSKTPKKSTKKASYDASDITVLEGLEAVRKRPGMYIGTTGTDGLYHLIWEAFDNSRDEAMAGHASNIEITLLPDDFVRVADNGRGIPVDVHKKTKISALETIMTTLHAGGKFGDGGYKVSGGLHGVGISVLNALSKHVRVIVHRDGGAHYQEYDLGKPLAKVKKIGSTKQNGTAVTFKADESIFNTTDFNGKAFDPKKIQDHVRNQAYLVKGLYITVIDARDSKKDIVTDEDLFIKNQLSDSPSHSFYYDGGLKAFVRHYNHKQKPIHQNIFYTEATVGDTNVEIALQYVDDISSRVFGFGNTILNTEGGTHITGFKTALTKTLNAYGKEKNLLKQGSFTGEDTYEGLTAVVSVKLPEIQFEGQTKSKLGSVEARSAVDSVFSKAFKSYLEEHPGDAKIIMGKVTLALEARIAARAAKDSVLRKGALDGFSTLPGKLSDCQSKNLDETELFIVEGDSAGGTAKQGRDRAFQAVLPLRGKILNVERVRIDKILSSEEIKTLTIALGTSIGEGFNIEKLRYGKIIIATDADVDGAHIRTLLLTLFYRHFKPLIEAGHIYFAQPPLYKVKKGKDVQYAYSDDERDKIIKKLSASKKDKDEKNLEEQDFAEQQKTSGIFVQRYKGLGEMNHNELKETTMSIDNRILKQVTIEDGEKADETFDMLMGQEVPPRKAFIQENATYAEIDI